MSIKIDKSSSLRLSGCLTNYSNINRYRFTLSISKSRNIGNNEDGGRRAEMLGEFWPYISDAS